MSERAGPERAVISAGCREAADVGAAVLVSGGNAVDAAIAASAVQCVRELPWCGLGGDGFALVSRADGCLEALNGAGAVPRALATASIPGGTLPRYGPLSISTPGLVDAWWRLWERYGSLPFSNLIEPAAALADDGFALDEAFVRALGRARTALSGDDPFVSELCEQNGSAAGERFRLPSLARTLGEIGVEGPAVFYQGRLGRAVAATVNRLGGLLSAEDLAEHSSEFEPPITVRYGAAEVSVTPPVSMGWVLLQLLMLYDRLEGRLLDDEADRLDLMVRCKHAAFTDLSSMPQWQEATDVASVLDSGSLDRWCADIREQRRSLRAPVTASVAPAAGGTDTTCLSVVDGGGLMVTFIHSLFNEFGSRVVVPGTGIVLNDRLAKQPALLGRSQGPPRFRRPLHTLVGYHVAQRGQRLVGATPGGRGQVQTNFQVLRAIIDDGASPQAAVDTPRWLSGTPRLPDSEDLLFLESGFPAGRDAELARRGHAVADGGAPADADLFGSCTIAGADAQRSETLGAADHRRGATLVRVDPPGSTDDVNDEEAR
ncbi:MAG: gamma-glutamyltransferase [Acidimicrobiaceae bacterium]|nr:gamma-glutamyltransferase [Acidimicrobiaceae bacterium]